jgi:hypothetical protein
MLRAGGYNVTVTSNDGEGNVDTAANVQTIAAQLK